MSEFKDALLSLENSVKAENKELIEKSLEKLQGEFGEKLQDSSKEVKQLVEDQVKAAESMLETKFNEFSAKLNEKRSKEQKDNGSFTENMKSFIADKFGEISNVKGGKVKFDTMEMKAVADMLTTGDHVTGDYIRDYNRTVVSLPGQALNVADLVPTVNIDGGTYTYIRETAGEGTIGAPTEGSAKAKVDFDFSHIDLSTDFIAGITIYSKKMRNNLQYLQSFLPLGLRRQYFIAENTAFNTVLAAAATVSTNLIGDVSNIAELVLADIADLDAANYSSANGVVMNTADWYAILNTEKSTGAGYGLPFGWTYDNGTLRCLGIPVFKANWVAATKYYVGDWSMIEKVVTEGLSLEFSDQQLFSENDIIARIEAQVGLAVKQPASLIIGDTDATA
jgi:HK97 family phage major capsid protein